MNRAAANPVAPPAYVHPPALPQPMDTALRACLPRWCGTLDVACRVAAACVRATATAPLLPCAHGSLGA